jgi:hypothetical protein
MTMAYRKAYDNEVGYYAFESTGVFQATSLSPAVLGWCNVSDFES